MNDFADDWDRICATDMTLAQRLQACAATFRHHGSPVAACYDAVVERLENGHAGAGSPQVGDAMPGFLLPDGRGRLVDLEACHVRQSLVISFNRGHWCGFCNVELQTLAQARQRFAELGAEVLSIMPDRQGFVRRLPASVTEELQVLSDIDNAYALSLGLGMWVDEPLRERMVSRALCLDVFQGNDRWMLPLPATFVVGRAGRVIARHVDADFRKRMDLSDIEAALLREAGR